MARVIILAPPSELFEFLGHVLTQEGYEVRVLHDAKAALSRIKSFPPHVLIVDSQHSPWAAQEVCIRIRRERPFERVRLLILRSASAVGWNVPASEGDAYLERPLHPRSLIASVKSLVARGRANHRARPIVAGDLVIDPASCRVIRSGKLLSLTPCEFRLLHYVVSHPNRVCRRDDLFRVVRGAPRISSRTIENLMRRLQEKTKGNSEGPSRIRTVRGQGYCFHLPRQKSHQSGKQRNPS
jgi:DNA-binding response OmpR family regulator